MKIPDRVTFRASCSPLTLLTAVLLAACDEGPIEWRGGAQQVSMPPRGDESAAPAEARLVLRADHTPMIETIAALPTSPAALDRAACPQSLRTARLSSTEVYAVWWSTREHGRASLVAARSDDAGGTWSKPVPVDTTDRSTVGCDRPAPAIAADPRSGYVHTTYFIETPAGPGVFFAHSMERGELFHSPVPIMYGARPAATAVAAADDVVVVAFEDPNSQRPRVSLAISSTWGHIFARERPAASIGTDVAEKPFVAVRDKALAVGWYTQARAVVARVGTRR